MTISFLFLQYISRTIKLVKINVYASQTHFKLFLLRLQLRLEVLCSSDIDILIFIAYKDKIRKAINFYLSIVKSICIGSVIIKLVVKPDNLFVSVEFYQGLCMSGLYQQFSRTN